MSTIVAFTVSSKEMGEEALERLDGHVKDVAMVYKTDKGKVKLVQTSDLTAGQGVVRGASLAPSRASSLGRCSRSRLLAGLRERPTRPSATRGSATR